MKKLITALLVLGLIAFTGNAKAEAPAGNEGTTRTETVQVGSIANPIAITIEYTNIVQWDGFSQADVTVYAQAEYPVASLVRIKTNYLSRGDYVEYTGPEIWISPGGTEGGVSVSDVQLYDFYLGELIASDDTYDYYYYFSW